MTRVTFGVSCSPYVAIRTTWRAAEDAGSEMEEARAPVRNNIYVDDYLDSAGGLDEAIRRATAVQKVLAGGDFHLSHWVSNSAQLLNEVQPRDDAGTMVESTTIQLGADDPEMVLRIVWRPGKDTLGFQVKLDYIVYTRAKIKLRELGVRGLHWDEPVTKEDRQWWEKYFRTIDGLKEVEFPRCLFPDADEVRGLELHTFADASEEACAASCYVRLIYSDQRVLIRLVKSAIKLAPLKTVSVCKLELNAALMGARLAHFVQGALRRRCDARFFWTDSSTVRSWVCGTSSHSQMYVSHRIGEIQTLTEPGEWWFVPGRYNPADAATRSQLEEESIPPWWINGPEFLYDKEESWPIDLPWTVAKEELRAAHVHLSVTEPAFD
ncbi:uncharacterized protein LOC123472602 [Daphnia magna]|uniref:uncharacterized protein LOC123472602 n=1 Tax=Daphnia magna TaxID=35525 RepID=UPI001E1BB3A2|nr:uncharacterized protein LOC123472602 [Daphnia magna]